MRRNGDDMKFMKWLCGTCKTWRLKRTLRRDTVELEGILILLAADNLLAPGRLTRNPLLAPEMFESRLDLERKAMLLRARIVDTEESLGRRSIIS